MPDSSSPPLTIDRYRLYDEVGTGGMARVHLAKLTGAVGFARVVAVKRLHPHLADEPALRAMFVDEARLSARIQDPHVVRTLDVIAHDGAVALVMEYVLGESLARALRGAAGPVLPAVAVAITVDVLRGLHAAHEARDVDGRPLGIVHRDVSPKNVLVGKDGVVRLIDFGIAKATRRLAVTATGDTKGTRAYMAPEQRAGGSISREADVYATAVVLREMLTGVQPGDDGLARHGGAVPGGDAPGGDAARAIPAELERVLRGALAERAADRPPTALAFADALVRAVTPARPVDVARWLEDVAGDALDLAEERLARVERTTDETTGAAAPDAAPAPSRAVAADTVVTVQSATAPLIRRESDAPRAPHEPHPGAPNASVAAAPNASPAGAPNASPAGAPNASPAGAPMMATPRREGGGGRIAAAVVACVVVLAGGAALGARAWHARGARIAAESSVTTGGAGAGAGAGAGEPDAAAGVTPRAPSALDGTGPAIASSGSPTTDSPSAGTLSPSGAALSPGAVTPGSPSSRAHVAGGRGVPSALPPATRRTSTTRAACNPPFTFDEAGRKIFNPRCF